MRADRRAPHSPRAATLACRAALLLALATGAHAAPDEPPPLSAIDWLSDSVALPEPAPAKAPAKAPGEAPAPPAPLTALPPAEAAALPGAPIAPAPTGREIEIGPLGAANPDAAGLISPETAGLPRDLWGESPTEVLAALLRAERLETLPALQTLLTRVLLAELTPPRDSTGAGTLLLARLDRLLDLGALDQAQALVERVGPNDPERFRRWFDIALLTGREDRACAALRAAPDIAPTFPARIFCLARGGDWAAAALTLEVGLGLGFVSRDEGVLLARFLDPDLAELLPPPPPPLRPSPLVFRIYEAVGEPMATTTLPRAFAHSDLRATAGWKARITAAERLARSGVLAPNRLLGIYSERRPAASGGLWARVAALQAFDVAMLAGDAAAVANTLPAAWRAMQEAELELPFATIYGARLAGLDLAGAPYGAGALALHIGLLSEAHAQIAAAHTPTSPQERFLQALATGTLAEARPHDTLSAAIQAGFLSNDPGPAMAALLGGGRRGEALLLAIDQISRGLPGNPAEITSALIALRALGLETSARRAALEMLLLDRRG